ncbi:MAG: hypothetical protein JSS57_04365 [Proteobacteria bacterium]|nr:hypothetical protein [Pseudomonadota bacterium]
MNIPQTLTSGNSATWSDSAWLSPGGALYSPPTYTLTYEIRGPGAALTLQAVQSGTGWETTLTATDSAGLTAGLWWWEAILIGGRDHRSADAGELRIVASLASITGPYDGRTQAERDLEAVNAAISARASGGMVQEYTIAGRSLKREPMAALLELRSALQIRVRNEKGISRNLYSRFR